MKAIGENAKQTATILAAAVGTLCTGILFSIELPALIMMNLACVGAAAAVAFALSRKTAWRPVAGDAGEIAHLEEAQAVSHTGSFLWSPDADALRMSDQACEILGYPANTSSSLDMIMDRIHPEDREAVNVLVLDAARARRGFDFEHRIRLPDDRLRHIRIRARSFEADPSCFVGAITDNTDIRQTEARLSESEYNYRNLFQAMAA